MYKAAYLARGEAHSRKGNADGAMSDYDQAIQIDPTYRAAYVYRATEYRAARDLMRAMADCDRAASLDPKDVYPYVCRGLTYQAMGDSERAVAACDRAIELAPKAAGIYRPCAMVQLQAGFPAKAVTYLDRSREIDPKDSYTALWREIAARRGNAASTLADATAKLDMTKWPAPVIRLFLGTTSADDVLHAADDPDPIKKKGQICEANFFTAELALQRGVTQEARRLFGLSLADCPPAFVEAQAAAAELKALGVNP
ncbi:lipoprotein NlpI [Bradyrhizobium huanghuaihaiense]